MAQQTLGKKGAELEEELEKKIEEIRTDAKEREYKSVAEKFELPFSDLKTTPGGLEALGLVKEEKARSAKLAVIYKVGAKILVAVTDPEDTETKKLLEELEKQGFAIKLVLTMPAGLENAWKKYKAIVSPDVFEIGAITIKEEELNQIQASIQSLQDLKNQITKISVTKLLEIFIGGALKIGASDVHFEPEAKNTRVRYRLDGYLQDAVFVETKDYKKVVNRVKVLAQLKLNIHDTPQDGRFTIRQKDTDVEVRVSVLPSEYGETIVMRLLDPRRVMGKIEELGMRDDILALVKKQLDKAVGVILTTGPTGSGKTTTLYSFVNYLNTPDTKIITIEDPIEYHITGISQTQVEPEKGYTFVNGLRAIVRQDPDVVLVGEIRDLETAEIAMQAALTGHIVLSTLHTNDAAGTIPRLVDLGVKSQTIAPALNMAMAQRLLRKLCPACKKATELHGEDLERIKKHMTPLVERFKLPMVDDKLVVYAPQGCKECNNLGFKGRIGVYEAFTISREMEFLILKNAPVSEIRDRAIEEGMVTFMQDAFLKLIAGTTALDEIYRVLGVV